MTTELDIARQIASGELPSPQSFGASWYWAIRISGTGVAYRSAVDEYCLRERSVWLTPEMIQRCACLPVLFEHPHAGMLNSAEFAARCIGLTVLAYVRDDELWAVSRILDANANELLASGEIGDTSPAVTFEPGSGQRLFVDGKPLLIEGNPRLVDHVCVTPLGVWTRQGEPGIEVTNEEDIAA